MKRESTSISAVPQADRTELMPAPTNPEPAAPLPVVPSNPDQAEPGVPADAYQLADLPPSEPAEPGEPGSRASEPALADESLHRVPEPEPVRIDSTFQPSEAAAAEPNRQADSIPDEPPDVSVLWNRWTDWKQPTIWGGAGVALATIILFAGPYVASLLFVASVLYASYRIVTSLEVPVRVTPEQAIKEFFSAAGHRLPNFDRMYGLLTDDGKRCDEFHNYSEFCRSWLDRIKRHGRSPNWLVPLEFHIEGFRCRYNADKSMASVRYTVKVAPRAASDSIRPVAVVESANLVVKASDGQWYVNDGRCPVN